MGKRRKKRQRATKIVLRLFKFRAVLSGDKETAHKIETILNSPVLLEATSALLDDKVETGGSFIENLLNWIAEHPEQFQKIIDMIMKLFAGM